MICRYAVQDTQTSGIKTRAVCVQAWKDMKTMKLSGSFSISNCTSSSPFFRLFMSSERIWKETAEGSGGGRGEGGGGGKEEGGGGEKGTAR